jgi:hypothetical protein
MQTRNTSVDEVEAVNKKCNAAPSVMYALNFYQQSWRTIAQLKLVLKIKKKKRIR